MEWIGGILGKGVIGRNIQSLGALEKVLGEAKYAADIEIENALHIRVLRSLKPHAKIIGIDTADAHKVSGVVRVFTAKDIPGSNRIGTIVKDQPILAEEKVRYVGEAIAMVVATSEWGAEEAVGKIEVQFEDLPAVFTPEGALRRNGPFIHEKGNLLSEREIIKGDIEEGFEEADVIIENTYTTSRVEHASLEPDAAGGFMDDDGRIIIYSSTQNVHYNRQEIASMLGLDVGKVRVIQAETGGGFGSKLDMSVQCFVALGVYHLKRPMKMVYSREEVFRSTSKRHPLKIRYKSGVKRSGKLVAVECDILGDTGAYASYGPTVCLRAAIHATGPYEIPNVKVRSRMVYTNNIWCGAMRGFGIPQIAFAHESQVDLLAERLGMDPIDFRLLNVLREGSSTATGQILSGSVGIAQTLERLKEKRAGVEQRMEARGVEIQQKPYFKKGVGVASMWYGIGNTGVPNPSSAQIEVDLKGKIHLYVGTADIGQGSDTVLVQIAAEELGLDPADISLVRADTELTTDTGATSASRQTYITGNAVLMAARNLKEKLTAETADLFDLNREDLTVKGGYLLSGEDPRFEISIEAVAERVSLSGKRLRGEGIFDPETTKLNPETGEGIPYATYAFASHLADVEVDVETGAVKVNRVIAAHDVGKAINPQSVIGQINGGVNMGTGFALMEEFLPDKTSSFVNYFIPTVMDVPEIIADIVEEEEPTGPFGAKGVGEPALIPAAPAILNAIAQALGERIFHLPATLERVLETSRRKLGIVRQSI